MRKLSKIKGLQIGDFNRIATLYNKRRNHKQTVTRSYVRMIVLGIVKCDSEKASEIRSISKRYFIAKRSLEKQLINRLSTAA